MCSDVVGPSSSGTGDLSDRSRSRTFTISPTISTNGRHLGFERDYNSHSAFRDVLDHHAYIRSIRQYASFAGAVI